MKIDVVIDTTCPWCFIGKKRLELLIANEHNLNFEINWQPYILNPEILPKGMDSEENLYKNSGGKTKYQKSNNTINQLAKNLNIEFNFSKIKRIPNTIDSHRMIKLASYQNMSTEMLESIFQNYFSMGNDIGNRSVLINIGTELGFARTKLKEYLNSDEDTSEILRQSQRIFHSGISGIPTFIFNEDLSISGIQDIRILRRLINIAEQDINSLFNKAHQSIIEKFKQDEIDYESK